MTTITTGRHYAVSLVHAATGKISAARFYNRAHGFGTLDDADILGPSDPTPPNTSALIPDHQLAGFLFSLFADRAALRAILDFAVFLPRDEQGQPSVYRYNLHCSACGHAWQDALPDLATIIPCERCRSRIEVRPHMISWQGPQSPALRALWEGLPPAAGFRAEFQGGFQAFPTLSGLAVHCPGGQRVILSHTNGKLTLAAIGKPMIPASVSALPDLTDNAGDS